MIWGLKVLFPTEDIFYALLRTPLPKTAGVLLLGTGGFAPAHTTTFFETACMMDDEREIHPFYFRTHTHKLGTLDLDIKEI